MSESIPLSDIPSPTSTISNQNNDPSPTSEERTWAILAHLSILLNLVTGLLGLLVALVIYLVYKDRSRYVAFHALQSLYFQLVFWFLAGMLATIIWVITIPLLLILVGFCLLPVAIFFSLVPIAAIIYSTIGAIAVGQGDDFRYWLVGNWAE
jgi:uncharacterized protein